MSHWTHTSVRKAQGGRSHRNNLLIRNQSLIAKQKLNRMGDIGKKMRLMAGQKESTGKE